MKFSHDSYAKFCPPLGNTKDGNKIVLVGIQEVESIFKVPVVFGEWDTRYYQDGKNCYYPLTDGKHIILFYFDVVAERVFPTIRKYTPEKLAYYKTKLFQLDKIEIILDEAKK